MCAAQINFPFGTDALIVGGLQLKILCSNLVKFVSCSSIAVPEKNNEYMSN